MNMYLVSVQIKLRNLEHQNGVLLAKYQAVMSMKDRRGPEGAQVCLGRSASSEIEQRFLTHIIAPPIPSAMGAPPHRCPRPRRRARLQLWRGESGERGRDRR